MPPASLASHRIAAVPTIAPVAGQTHSTAPVQSECSSASPHKDRTAADCARCPARAACPLAQRLLGV